MLSKQLEPFKPWNPKKNGRSKNATICLTIAAPISLVVVAVPRSANKIFIRTYRKKPRSRFLPRFNRYTRTRFATLKNGKKERRKRVSKDDLFSLFPISWKYFLINVTREDRIVESRPFINQRGILLPYRELRTQPEREAFREARPRYIRVAGIGIIGKLRVQHAQNFEGCRARKPVN